MGEQFINAQPFRYVASHGTSFDCPRSDLSEPVHVIKPDGLTVGRLAADFAEFGSQHALHVYPWLNGFQGYDAVRYHFGV